MREDARDKARVVALLVRTRLESASPEAEMNNSSVAPRDYEDLKRKLTWKGTGSPGTSLTDSRS